MTNRDEGDLMNDRFRSSEDMDCGSVRDLLPLSLLRVLPSEEARLVEAHLQSCKECRDEGIFLTRLQSARSEPPPGLHRQIVGSLAKGRRSFGKIWGWGVPAVAAVIALALGLGTVLNQRPSNEEIWSLALQPEAPAEWLGENWMVAGAPMLHALSDEVLREVLEELDP
ncbi:MAG: zf-HC2 domain-containing protein [Gemmatimonadota bacterium]